MATCRPAGVAPGWMLFRVRNRGVGRTEVRRGKKRTSKHCEAIAAGVQATPKGGAAEVPQTESPRRHQQKSLA